MLEDEKGTSVSIWVSLTGGKLWWLDQSFKWAVSIKSVPKRVDQRPRLIDASKERRPLIKITFLESCGLILPQNQNGSRMFEDLSNKSEVLIWPQYYPDLSPAETLWNVQTSLIQKGTAANTLVPDITADQQGSCAVKSSMSQGCFAS